MKNAKIKSKKIVKITKPLRVAGMQVRSGVKAGWQERDPGGSRSFTGPDLRRFG